MKATACTRVSGAGKDVCASFVGTTHPIILSLRRAGTVARGSLRMFRLGAGGEVSGTFYSDTSARLDKGTLYEPENQIVIELHDWQLLRVGSSIEAGPLRVRDSFDNSFGRQVREETFEVLRLERKEPLAP